ncbi:MAG: glycoside hydrolase family 13 protein [Kordiimonas sp.]
MKQIASILVAVGLAFGGSLQVVADAAIERIEPPFWWAGFEERNLQILVYGDRISDYMPEISAEGISLKQINRVKSPNYLFLDVTLDASVKAGSFDITFNKDGADSLTHSYELRAREAGSAERKGFDTSDAIYLITPDRFANGNPDNDNADGMGDALDRSNKDGRHGGDVAGITQHLDYIEDMGFTAFWLNPVLENAQPSGSYHGYATTDFYKVDPRFGSNEAFRDMVKKARAKNIDVIMDMIVNHSGSEHWWLKDLPTDDWINYSGEYVNTSHRRTTIQDPYSAEFDRKKFSDGWFVETMPDLNQRNKLMADYLIQNAIWWIEYSGIAGIRMDTYPYPDKHFMTDWTRRVMREYPNFNIVGEEWSVDPLIVSYWQRGKANRDGYVSSLPSMMDFPMQDTLVKALTEEESWGGGLMSLYKLMASDVLYPEPDNLVIFPDNHDMSRIFTQLGEDKNLYKMAIAHTLTMRGIPQIYYGTEILMKNPGTTDHGIIRTDFPGGWAGDQINAFTGAGLSAEALEAQGYVQKLLRWRKDKQVIHTGKLMHYVPENGVYVYFRYNDTDKVMVALNKNAAETELPLARFSEMLAGVSQGEDVASGQTFDFVNSITLPARSALILNLAK